ncbi:MAG: transglutaminase-like domain-containing protein [Rikenellaceae bacterium]
MRKITLLFTVLTLVFSSCNDELQGVDPQIAKLVTTQLATLPSERAAEIMNTITNTPEERREGMAFLFAYMPQHDLDTLSIEVIEKNVEYAYKARTNFEWCASLPLEVFYNDVLPYVTMDETRENWREPFYAMLEPVVKESKDAFAAIDTINKALRDLVNVDYNTKRKRANQSPFESMEINMASCSGLSILLTDALRAAGLPARIAGAPMWITKEGNHNWSEVWVDGKWYIIEYYPAELNNTWFLDRCAAFEGQDDPQHQVYATSYMPTSQKISFPMVWNKRDTSVNGEKVTDRYVARYKELEQQKELQENGTAIEIRAAKKGGDVKISGDRIAIEVKIIDSKSGEEIAKGKTSGPNADMNDYLVLYVPKNGEYKISYDSDSTKTLKVGDEDKLEVVLNK